MAIGRARISSSEGWGAGDGGPSDGQRERKLGFVRRPNSHNLHAEGAIRIGEKLPLSVEMADRAIVSRGVLLIAVSRRRLTVRGELGGTMAEPGKCVQGRATQGDDTIEGQNCGQ